MTLNDNEAVSNGATHIVDAFFDRLKQETVFTAMVEDGTLVTNSAAQVAQFHNAFSVPILERPGLPSPERMSLRLALIDEELIELKQAIAADDIGAIAKELADLQYVIDGTFLEFGLGGIKAHIINAVHASNMSKIGDDGRPVLRDDGKVLKGPNYKPVDISGLLAALVAEDGGGAA